MKDVNKVILVGRLGKDPIQRATRSGTSVTHFSMATTRKFKQLTEGQETLGEETQWHNVVAWGKQAEVCALYLKKGNLVYIEGSVKSQYYTTKDGEKRMSFEIHADNVSFLGRSPGQSGGPSSESDDLEDLPEATEALSA